ncbi:hypothetical protein G7Y79_00006g018370 [Physcia stellaris]|nr:hypothetical protein G7Y79_00006g018370 [Physcia stellaris]
MVNLLVNDRNPHANSATPAECDIRNNEQLDSLTLKIAAQNQRLDGLIAAAGVQDPPLPRWHEYHCPGSMILIVPMSGFVANEGPINPVYNSSKAAVIQLGRNLAMEWGKEWIRVNRPCPGHIITPMVPKNLEDDPSWKGSWEKENMLGRLSTPEEYV